MNRRAAARRPPPRLARRARAGQDLDRGGDRQSELRLLDQREPDLIERGDLEPASVLGPCELDRRVDQRQGDGVAQAGQELSHDRQGGRPFVRNCVLRLSTREFVEQVEGLMLVLVDVGPTLGGTDFRLGLVGGRAHPRIIHTEL
jgi:hypothetical protein